MVTTINLIREVGRLESIRRRPPLDSANRCAPASADGLGFHPCRIVSMPADGTSVTDKWALHDHGQLAIS
jgi:hypothetical protein